LLLNRHKSIKKGYSYASTSIDFLASLGAETILHPDAVTLPDFPRSIQLDDYSCGAKSVFTILHFYKKPCTPESVEKQLHTDSDGTSVSDIKRILKRHGLIYRTLRKSGLRELKAAINNGYPILITLYDLEHYAVVYGFSSSHMFVMNSSVDFSENSVGSVWCAIRKDRFKRMWDKWGLEVSE
jgi:predicted double-glycine peptidase